MTDEPTPAQDLRSALERGPINPKAELEAFATLLERPPLDDIEIERDLASRIAISLRRVLTAGTPVNMLLWCPKCHAQHIDEPSEDWDNPPHRSHLCHDCGCIWRPADVTTNGVAEIKTAGDADTWGWTGGDSLLPSLGKRLTASLAQPAENAKAGEVVTWLYEREDGSRDLLLDCNGEYARRLLEIGATETPLYAHPPAAEPVGLREALETHHPVGIYKQPCGNHVLCCDCGENLWGVDRHACRAAWRLHLIAALATPARTDDAIEYAPGYHRRAPDAQPSGDVAAMGMASF